MAGADEAGQIPQTPVQAPQAPEQRSGEPVQNSVEPAQSEQVSQTPQAPGFGERGRMRRRARFLRRARELAYRDLGGLVFDLHRFGQRNDPVVLAKLATLGHIDAELRALEEALRELKPVTVLREAGIAACPRCAAIHGSDDHFCPGCGLAFDAGAERPLSTAPVTPPALSPGHAPAAMAAMGSQLASRTPQDLSIGRPPSPPAAAALPMKPTAAPVPAKPAFPGASSPVAGALQPGGSASQPVTGQALEPVSPPADSVQRGAPPASAPATPFATTPSQSAPTESGSEKGKDEQKQEPEDEPTQILRPPASGA